MTSILTRTHVLESGPVVRLRLVRRADERALAALLEERGLSATELELRRLLRCDPTERVALCALALIDGHDTVVGVGAIDLARDADVDTLVVDEAKNPGLGELLVTVLRAHAEAHARRVA